MKQVEKISVSELKEMAKKMYGLIVKADVDVIRELVVMDMGMHVDGEAFLLENDSKQKDVWGINLHPEKYGTDEFVEFESMINLRPSHGNFSRGVDDLEMRKRIRQIVDGIVHE